MHVCMKLRHVTPGWTLLSLLGILPGPVGRPYCGMSCPCMDHMVATQPSYRHIFTCCCNLVGQGTCPAYQLIDNSQSGCLDIYVCIEISGRAGNAVKANRMTRGYSAGQIWHGKHPSRQHLTVGGMPRKYIHRCPYASEVGVECCVAQSLDVSPTGAYNTRQQTCLAGTNICEAIPGKHFYDISMCTHSTGGVCTGAGPCADIRPEGRIQPGGVRAAVRRGQQCGGLVEQVRRQRVGLGAVQPIVCGDGHCRERAGSARSAT